MDERTLKHPTSRMVKFLGEGAEDSEVSRTFQVQDPAHFLGLDIVLESDLLERFKHMASSVVNAVRGADESYHSVPTHRFVEDHLRVTGRDDLAAGFSCCFAEHLVNLALAQDLKMRVWLVEQQHGTGVCRHVRKQEEGLLLAAPARRKVEPCAGGVAVRHHDFASLTDVLRLVEHNAKERLHAIDDRSPLGRFSLERLPAKIAQHLGGAALPNTNSDRAFVESGLVRHQPGHRRQVR